MTATRARALRRDMTDAERKLWSALRGRRLAGAKFRRQVPVGPYVADFLSKRYRLAVEVDGGRHGGPRDRRRDAAFAALGYRTLRFWNFEVLSNPDGVLETIARALAETSPSAPLERARAAPAGRAGRIPLSQEWERDGVRVDAG